MRKILLFRLGGLGDLLVTLPSIHLIRKCYPSSVVSLVCQKKYGDILEKTDVVDECLSQDARQMAPLFSDSLAFREELDLRFRGFDGVVGWCQKGSSLSGVEPVLSSREMRFRLFVYEEQGQEVISRYFFRKTQEFISLQKPKIPRFQECARLPLSSTQKKNGGQLLSEKHPGFKDKIVVIHPGSGNREKCWPFPNFLHVVRRLHRESLRGVLVTGPAEERLEEEIKKSSLPANWVWLHDPPLIRLAGLLSASDFYLGNDSGISHLAAACGTEGLALFRKDLKHAWKPYGRIAVLSEDSVEHISMEAVQARIEKQLFSV